MHQVVKSDSTRSLVVDYLQPRTNNLNRHKTAVTHFYFEDRLREKQSSEDFIRALIKQLVYQSEKIPVSVVEAHERFKRHGAVAQPDKIALLQLLKDCLQIFSTVFIVIDAFDECNKKERRQIARFIEDVPKSKLRLFVTGRTSVLNHEDYTETDPLRAWLEGAIEIKIRADSEDITKYLRKELMDPELETVDPATTKEFKTRIMTEILSAADGQYLHSDSQIII